MNSNYKRRILNEQKVQVNKLLLVESYFKDETEISKYETEKYKPIVFFENENVVQGIYPEDFLVLQIKSTNKFILLHFYASPEESHDWDIYIIGNQDGISKIEDGMDIVSLGHLLDLVELETYQQQNELGEEMHSLVNDTVDIMFKVSKDVPSWDKASDKWLNAEKKRI